ncbi:MAG: DNA gyrase inhibitor YacG [Neisseriales bacterium]|nr:MAG: DNA gyrase inhibitor YacG [Neisseriales bacterium]
MDTKKPLRVLCPHCKMPVDWISSNQFKPFCSERCRLIDLGEWASEHYVIPSDKPPLV